MFRLVFIPNLGLLMSLESLEKFLCCGGGGGGGWCVMCKPILVFSLSLNQDEQQDFSQKCSAWKGFDFE